MYWTKKYDVFIKVSKWFARRVTLGKKFAILVQVLVLNAGQARLPAQVAKK